MANYNNLKATINANIKANGNEEITGPILNTVLNQAVTTLGDGWSYKGIATPSMSPGTPDSNVFYIATTAGTYTNFGSLVVAEGEVAILKYNGSWAKDVTGAATAAQVTQLGQEVGGLTITNQTRANGVIHDLTNPLPSGITITSIVGYVEPNSLVILYEDSSDTTGTRVYPSSLPYITTKAYTRWQGYESGSPNITMVARTPGVLERVSALEEGAEQVDGRLQDIEQDIEQYDEVKKDIYGTTINSPTKQTSKGLKSDGSVYNSGALDIYTELLPNGISKIWTKFNSYSNPANVGYAFYGENDSLLSSGASLAGTDVDKNGVWLGLDVPAGATKFSNSVAKITDYGLIKFDYEGVKTDLGMEYRLEVVENELARVPLQSQVPEYTIPQKIYTVKGEKLLLFKNTLGNNIDFSKIHIRSAYLKDFPRYFAVNPTANGEYSLPIEYFGQFSPVSTPTPKLVVFNAPTNPSSVKNVLVVGSSTTANYKTQYEELYRRICLATGTQGDPSNPKGLGLSNINFVGRMSNGQNFKYEATGGFGWGNYTDPAGTNNNYAFTTADPSLYNIGDVYTDGTYQFEITEISQADNRVSAKCATQDAPISASGTMSKVSGTGPDSFVYTAVTATITHPFDLGNGVSLSDYMDAYCNGVTPHIVIFQDLIFNSGGVLTNAIKTKILSLLQSIVTDYPGVKILISSEALPSQNGGLGTNYTLSSEIGCTALITQRLRKLISDTDAFVTELNGTLGDNTVFYVPQAIECDADYDYPSQDTIVNYRVTSIEESIGTNGMHPTSSGILNHIDSFYRVLAYVIKQYFN